MDEFEKGRNQGEHKQFVGGESQKKQKAWFKGLKSDLNEQQHELKEDFLPVLVKDFLEVWKEVV